MTHSIIYFGITNHDHGDDHGDHHYHDHHHNHHNHHYHDYTLLSVSSDVHLTQSWISSAQSRDGLPLFGPSPSGDDDDDDYDNA